MYKIWYKGHDTVMSKKDTHQNWRILILKKWSSKWRGSFENLSLIWWVIKSLLLWLEFKWDGLKSIVIAVQVVIVENSYIQNWIDTAARRWRVLWELQWWPIWHFMHEIFIFDSCVYFLYHFQCTNNFLWLWHYFCIKKKLLKWSTF